MQNIEAFHIFLPIFMKFLFLILFIFTFYNWKKIIISFSSIGKKTWLILFFILLFAFFLRFFWIPHEQITAADGENWTELSIRLHEYGIHARCDFDTDNGCRALSYIPYPPAYTTLLSMLFKVFEVNEKTAFKFNSAIGVTIVFFAFLLAYLWTKREDVALISALIFGMIAPLLKFSGAVAPALFSVFFLLLTLIFYRIFLERREMTIFLLFLTSLLCTSYIRPETFFLAPILMVLLFFQKEIREIFNKSNKFFLAILLIVFFLFLLPALYIINVGSNIVPYDGWTPTIKESVDYFLNHLSANLYFFVNSSINSFIFIIFALLGIIERFLKDKRELFFYSFIFLFYFILYSAFDTGIFEGLLVRFSLILYVPLFFFFVKGLQFFIEKIPKYFFKKMALIFVVFLFFLTGAKAIPYILSESDAERNMIKQTLYFAKEKIPKDAYVVSFSASATRSILERKAVSGPIFTSNSNYFNNKKIFLFKEDIWDNTADARYVYQNYELIPVEIITYEDRERGVYELVKKEALIK